jgi:hypothetical protein
VMLRVHCNRLDKDVIVWASDWISIDNAESGVALRYRCACGLVAELVDGRTVPTPLSAHLELVA